MTAFVVLRLAAEEPPVLDEMVTFSRRADGTIGSTQESRKASNCPFASCCMGFSYPRETTQPLLSRNTSAVA